MTWTVAAPSVGRWGAMSCLRVSGTTAEDGSSEMAGSLARMAQVHGQGSAREPPAARNQCLVTGI